MIARRVSMAIGLVMLAITVFYLFAYLYWWEWNHALIAGVFALAIEIGLLAVIIMGRLAKLEERLDPRRAPLSSPTRAIVHDNRPAPSDPFAWLSAPARRGEVGVFVPVLLGAGVILSGIAWVVERLARLFGGPTLERDLAGRLERLSPPPSGLLATADDPLMLLRRPTRS